MEWYLRNECWIFSSVTLNFFCCFFRFQAFLRAGTGGALLWCWVAASCWSCSFLCASLNCSLMCFSKSGFSNGVNGVVGAVELRERELLALGVIRCCFMRFRMALDCPRLIRYGSLSRGCCCCWLLCEPAARLFRRVPPEPDKLGELTRHVSNSAWRSASQNIPLRSLRRLFLLSWRVAVWWCVGNVSWSSTLSSKRTFFSFSGSLPSKSIAIFWNRNLFISICKLLCNSLTFKF